MSSRKSMSGRGEKQARGKSGPDSSTENGKRRGKKEKASTPKRLPKMAKRDAGKSDSYGGNMH